MLVSDFKLSKTVEVKYVLGEPCYISFSLPRNCIDESINEKIVLQGARQYGTKSAVVDRHTAQAIRYYFERYQFYQNAWGQVDVRCPLLVFSYGAGEKVNQLLAQMVINLMTQDVRQLAIVQWEIALLVTRIYPELHARIKSINLKKTDDYLTTLQVAHRALNFTKLRRVTVVAQAWHASRCVRQARIIGWSVSALRVVDEFADSDIQPWVRHPLDWIIKESKMRYIEYKE